MYNVFRGGRAWIRLGFAVAAGPATFGLTLVLVPPPPSAVATEAASGLELAATCVACHHTDGRSTGIPSLAGLQSAALAAALRDFRDGRRSGMIMQVVARSLTEDEIARIGESLTALNAAEARR